MKRIPRKDELLRLQSQYKTDRKIAEALGNIPEYLVAYWRRKKGIPRYAEPKFSQRQIEEVWMRFGDDFRAGRELNLSRAAFYSWRRKYGISDKPTVLALEQLELSLDTSDRPVVETERTIEPQPPAQRTRNRKTTTAPRTIVEKILGSTSEEENGHQTTVTYRPFACCERSSNGDLRLVFASRGSANEEYELLDTTGVSRPDPGDFSVIRIPERLGEPGWRILESRTVTPGKFVISSERCLKTLGAAGILVLDGDTIEPKRVIKVEMTRRLGPQLDVDDAIIELLTRGVDSDWSGRIVEFLGAPVEHLSMDRKAKLCRVAVQSGAKAALCPFDDVSRRYFGRTLKARKIEAHPDRAARYDGEHFLELRGLERRLWDLRESRAASAKDAVAGRRGLRCALIIGPDALEYELEATANALEDSDGIRRGATLLVLPATMELFRVAMRRGWTSAISNAGGSVVDPQLVHALGLKQLLPPVDRQSSICVTSPVSPTLTEASLFYGGAGTLIGLAARRT